MKKVHKHKVRYDDEKTVILFLLSALLLFSGCTDNKAAPEAETPIPAAEESAPAPILLPDGSEVEADTVSLCPHGNVGEDLLAWQEALSQLPALRELDLTGSTLSAEELRSLQESCAARLYYAPTVCGRKLELDLTSCAPAAESGGANISTESAFLWIAMSC